MAISGTGYIKREAFMTFVDVSATATPEWELIGDKVEELSIAMNPNINTVSDVTGNTSTTLDRYQEQTDVSPMRARKESKLFAILYAIVKEKKTLSDVERDFLCVNVFDASAGQYSAWKQRAVIAVQSFGGNTQGLDVPFNIHWMGERTHGTFNPSTNSFTPSTGAQQLVTFSVSGTAAARLPGAQILINGQLLVTDANGIAEILLPAGAYSYTVAMEGYEVVSDSLTVSTAAVYEAVSMTAE